jgi:hypothetical protein
MEDRPGLYVTSSPSTGRNTKCPVAMSVTSISRGFGPNSRRLTAALTWLLGL